MASTFQIVGVQMAISNLSAIEKQIKDRAEQGIKEAAFHIKGEVVQSIGGHRDEPTSVDTSLFKNTIDVNKVEDGVWEVFSHQPYSIFLEEGTTKMQPGRHHFRETIKRERAFVRNKIQKWIDGAFK